MLYKYVVTFNSITKVMTAFSLNYLKYTHDRMLIQLFFKYFKKLIYKIKLSKIGRVIMLLNVLTSVQDDTKSGLVLN